jgi:uncharacterized protein YndB with AHSA1/START domain
MTYTPAPFEPGPTQPVSARASGGHWTLTFTQLFPHPPEAVWASLTDPLQLREWAPYAADRDLGAVGPATLTMTDGLQATQFDGSVSVAQPPRVLEHAWGTQRLRWELEPVAAGTELTLLHTIDQQTEISSNAAGWHLCLLVAERFLDGTPIGPIVGARALDYGFAELQDAYAAVLSVTAG